MSTTTEAANHSTSSMRWLTWLSLLGGLILYFLLRARWIGHLLTWDEAMNLCAIRSFVSRGHDYFSYWFWRHPPAYKTVLMLLGSPLAPGFPERAEWISLCIGAGGLGLLFMLNRAVYGLRVALFSIIFLAAMPRAVFFDLWVKSDVAVVLPALLAIYLFLKNRLVPAGMILGIAFLTKETAAYYAIAVAVLWYIQGDLKNRWRVPLVLGITAVAVSGWWYAIFSVSLKQFATLATGLRLADAENNVRPWYYYLVLLTSNLGISGVCISILGVLALRVRMAELSRGAPGYADQMWPLAVLVPSYLALTASLAKSVHFSTGLEPGWATLEALGLDVALGALMGVLVKAIRWPKPVLHGIQALVVAAVFGHMTLLAWTIDYEKYLGSQDPGMLWGATSSRDAARAVNRAMKEGENALITPMYYWPEESEAPDPIFVCYLKPVPVVLRSNRITEKEFVDVVRLYEIEWAMVSPPPGEGESALVIPLARDYGLEPHVLRGALLYHTTPLYANAAPGPQALVPPHAITAAPFPRRETSARKRAPRWRVARRCRRAPAR